jgi:cell wall-associated NlpC family hydrolase
LDSSLIYPKEKDITTRRRSDKKMLNINVDSLINFAKSLLGTAYVYASSDPSVGFDCSGFITYVFNHFNASVPRSSIDFTDEGITIPLQKSKRGDLILFTGTDSTERFVGHMGIVVENKKGVISFIHSTSGKAHGVTITQLNDYYMGRFVKVVRIINE